MLTAIKQNFWLRLAIFAALAIPLAIATLVPTDYTMAGAFVFGRLIHFTMIPAIGGALVAWLLYNPAYGAVAAALLVVLLAGMGIG